MDAQVNNDTRGWIMTAVSGVACIAGSSIICIDLLICRFPGKKHFRIQDNSVFLAASLSLSFGVMIYSALYSMLPSSKSYLGDAGFKPSHASWILLASFICGFVGIQVLSRFLHRYMPSHVEPCDHTHKETSEAYTNETTPAQYLSTGQNSRKVSWGNGHSRSARSPRPNGESFETTPLLIDTGSYKPSGTPSIGRSGSRKRRGRSPGHAASTKPSLVARKSSMREVPARVMLFVQDKKVDCGADGRCYGYSDRCMQECKKHLAARNSSASRHSLLGASTTGSPSTQTLSYHNHGGQGVTTNGQRRDSVTSADASKQHPEFFQSEDEDVESQHQVHHHHVPENSFMAIGLQTSSAIALHKLPEGFITYATNRANPSLGFSVFMALFIHNISEGFAMALPLYLALGSRLKAMLWASFLGGISQPLGAGIAALWFKLAGHEGHKPGNVVYGCMFGITSGIMASVALQLFVESLTLNHNRNLCVGFAFVGMTIMGISGALTV